MSARYAIETFDDRRGQPRARIVSTKNGKTIWSGEDYATKGSRGRTIRGFMDAVLNGRIVVREAAKDGKVAPLRARKPRRLPQSLVPVPEGTQSAPSSISEAL